MMLLLLFAQLSVFLATPERLVVTANDEALGRAIVRSANLLVAGSVEFLPPGTPPPPRMLRLLVREGGSDSLTLVLSRGAKPSVTRQLRLAGHPTSFDRAEAAALAIADLRARLDEQLARAHPAIIPPLRMAGTAVAAAHTLPPTRSSAPKAAARAVEQLTAAIPPSLPPPSADSPPPEQAPAAPESLSGLIPVAAAPLLRTDFVRLSLSPVMGAKPSAARQRWRIGVGVSLELLGLALSGLGVASLALDGRCVDDAVPCEYRYDGRNTGALEVTLGGVAALAGLGLLGSLGYERSRQPPATAVSPQLAVALEF